MKTRGRPITVTDDDLLDAARDVFLACGLDATTTEIAQRARISESVIFYRYKTKEALFWAVFKRQLTIPPAFKRLALVVGQGEIAENLFDAGMGLGDLMHAVLPFMMMSLSTAKMNCVGRHARHSHPMKKQMTRSLSKYFEGEVRAGRLRPIDGEILARTFLGAIMQYAMSEHVEPAPGRMGISTFLRGMIDALLRGTLAGEPIRSALPLRKGR